MYLNYYEIEINDVEDSKPMNNTIWKKASVVAEYSLSGINNNLPASIYTYYMPNKEKLITKIDCTSWKTIKDVIRWKRKTKEMKVRRKNEKS